MFEMSFQKRSVPFDLVPEFLEIFAPMDRVQGQRW